MLRGGRSYVDFGRSTLSSSEAVLLSGSGSTGAIEKNAALNVAIRIGLEGGGGGLGEGLSKLGLDLERRRSEDLRRELRRRRFLLRSLSMMEKFLILWFQSFVV